MDLVQSCSLLKIHVFLGLEQLNNQQKESPQTCDVVWLSQHKFHMDLSFASISIKFLPRVAETKLRGMAAITPNFGLFSKLHRLQHHVGRTL